MNHNKTFFAYCKSKFSQLNFLIKFLVRLHIVMKIVNINIKTKGLSSTFGQKHVILLNTIQVLKINLILVRILIIQFTTEDISHNQALNYGLICWNFTVNAENNYCNKDERIA